MTVIVSCGAYPRGRGVISAKGKSMYLYDNPFKIRKIEKPVSLWAHPDGLVLGSIFLHLPEPDRSNAEDPWSVLNGADDFLVVRLHEPEGLRFYNKASLIRVEYTEEESYVADAGKDLPCRIHMMDGSILDGAMRKSLPPERSRLYDYMNTDNPRFLKLYTGGSSVCLINKTYVGYIATLDNPPKP